MNKLTFGIFAHIDAGKTTLSERILLEAEAIRTAGSVDSGTSATDFLPVERRRGISVRDAAVTFPYRGTQLFLIDTPGHADFTEETELALGAVDAAVVVVSAAEGIEAQTERLTELVAARAEHDRRDARGVPYNTPSGADAAFTENAVTLLGDERLLEDYLAGTLSKDRLHAALLRKIREKSIVPLIYGSARTGVGINVLLSLLSDMGMPFDVSSPFSAYVYQITRNRLGKCAHVRVYAGSIAARDEIPINGTEKTGKATQLKRILGEKLADTAVLSAGEAGAILGLADVRAGDVLGAPLPFAPPKRSEPYLRVKLTPQNADVYRLKEAIGELEDESPSLAAEWSAAKRELVVRTAGSIYTEVLLETLRERYGIEATAGTPSVIYRETPVRAAYGFEAYTMPKPCWAVVQFYIEPLPVGSGLVYESKCSEKKIAYRYQHHVETCVPRALQEGRLGWQVTDLKVTLTDGEDHPIHTHPLDFFVATPVGLHDALRNAGTRLLEPVLRATVKGPEDCMGKLIGELTPRRAKLQPPSAAQGTFTMQADIPASEAFDLPERVSMLSGGRARYEAHLLGYFPCPEGYGQPRERTSLDPLDRAKWILHARGAL